MYSKTKEMSTLRELYFRHMGLPSRTPFAIEVDQAEGIYFWDTEENVSPTWYQASR